MLITKPQKDIIYHVTFEEYLRPKKPHKVSPLQLVSDNEQARRHKLKCRVAEPHVKQVHATNKWQQIYPKVKRPLENFLSTPADCSSTNKFAKLWQKSRKFVKLTDLPNILAFLRARNDDGLCKRKTGFEIYCEMASFHGFVNFVNATTWQRVFWFLTICTAIIVTIIVLVMSHLMIMDTPTMVYTESTTYTAAFIPFPAITICDFNKISKRKALQVANEFSAYSSLTQQEMLRLFQLTLYNVQLIETSKEDFQLLENLLVNTNYTMTKLMHKISTSCEDQVLRCKWRGKIVSCRELFETVNTEEGLCCAFNYYGRKETLFSDDVVELNYVSAYGYRSGLTVLLATDVADYMAASVKAAGYQVLIHDAFETSDTATERQFVHRQTESTIGVSTRQTYATDYVRGERLERRRCYFANEHPQRAFRQYAQSNCIAQCRSQLINERCGCVPPFWTHLPHWRVCNATESLCVLKAKADLMSASIKAYEHNNTNRNDERYAHICNCFPPCEFNQYHTLLDCGVFDRSFRCGEQKFFKNITTKDHILLHIFYNDAMAERLRVDVYENWLTFIGTFGGVAGLYMGYSAVSFFEMIFFVFVRPACNWLTMKQIRYRIKRRQKKAAQAAKVKKALK